MAMIALFVEGLAVCDWARAPPPQLGGLHITDGKKHKHGASRVFRVKKDGAGAARPNYTML
jgi:hypothetical protein